MTGRDRSKRWRKVANDVEPDGNEGGKGERDVPPESTDVERIAERTEEESQAGTEDCDGDEHEQAKMRTQGERTIADTTADETGDGEEAVEDAVGDVGEGDVLGTTGTEVRDGGEHAHGGETTRNGESDVEN